MNIRLRNTLAVAVCAAIFLIYIVLVAPYIAPGTSRIISTVGVLVVLGFLTAPAISGSLLVKLLVLVFVPVVHIVYEGVDPAKPTLNLLVGLIELACIWLGAGLGHLVRRNIPWVAVTNDRNRS